MARRRNTYSDQDPTEERPRVKLTKESFFKALKTFEYIRPYKWYFFASLLLVFISTFSFYAIFYIIGQMIDAAQGQSDLNLSMKSIGQILIVILLIQGVISYLRVVFTAQVSENGIADVRNEVHSKLITLPITFFEENNSGELISRVSADVGKLYSVFSITLIEFFRQVITLIVGIGFLIFKAPKLSLIMLLTIPIVVVTALFFARIIKKLSRERQKLLAESNKILGESVQGIQVVKSFANEDFEMAKYDKSISNVVVVAMKYARSRAWFSLFIMTIFFGAMCFIIFMGAKMVQSGAMTAGDLVAFSTFTGIIGGAIAGLGNFTTELFGAVGATERIKEILGLEPEVIISQYDALSASSAKDGSIIFEDVHFAYPSRPESMILDGFNMEVGKNQTIALVGPSGVGKSTIVQLILRMYDIQQGKITLDGSSIYDEELRSYRKRISLVPQEVVLFADSIRDNIKYGKTSASDEEVIEAARKANCLEFIQEFPQGMDTMIGERGIKLSGGQRQRLAIARAILSNPEILLLDEATSALDAQSEKKVQEALDILMQNRTSIIIAHRLSTILDADCIYVIKEGKVFEKGTHSQLMAMEGMYFEQAKLGRLFE